MHLFDILTAKSGPRPPIFHTFEFEMCFAPQRRAFFHHLNFQNSGPTIVSLHFWLGTVLRATTACTFLNISSSKSDPTMVCFYTFDFEMCFSPRQRALFEHLNCQKCASCHNGMHFFNISTSKSGPTMMCFYTFDFQMCFAPQRHALFQHLNFQMCPTMVCFYAFGFQMCFAPQRHAIFHLSSPQMAPHLPL